MTDAFRALLNRLAMPGLERQLALRDKLGAEPDWRLDLAGGRALFDGVSYGLHLLGTRADDDTWQWAWDGAPKTLPAALQASAKKVRQVGKRRACPELAESGFPLAPLGIDAHALALVGTGLAELPAYFRFPYREGALFAALETPALLPATPDPARAAEVIDGVWQRFDVDPRVATEAYLRGRGLAVASDRDRITARWPDGTTRVFAFDAGEQPRA
jgi:hypothetical protein